MSPETPLERTQRSHWLRAILLPVGIGIALVIAFPKLMMWRPAFAELSQSAVYRIDNGAWRELPALPGRPEKLGVSSKGKIWALFWRRQHGHEFARLEDTGWRFYGPREFGTREIAVENGFAMDGDGIWALTDEGILHFDGTRWSMDPSAGKGKESPTDVLAGGGHVWAVYDQSRIASYEDGQWITRTTGLPPSNPDSDDPEYACTSDGALWVVNSGVWRGDTGGWKKIEFAGQAIENAWLAGSSGDRLWVRTGDHLLSLRKDGAGDDFLRASLGLAKDEFVHGVAQSGSATFGTAGPHILSYDGAAWHRVASAPATVSYVSSVVASEGHLFAIGNIPNPLGPKVRFFMPGVTIALFLALLAIPIWTVRRYKRHELREHQALQNAVAHGTGVVPDEFVRDERILARQSSWWSATVAVGTIVGAWIVFSIAGIFWRGIPVWMFLVIAFAVHGLVTISQTLVRRTARPWDPIEPGGPGFDWGPTLRALPGSVAVFVLMNLGHFPKWMGNPVRWIIYTALALMWCKLIEQKLIVLAINRGDHDAALTLVRRFRFYNLESGKALMVTGHILLRSGRLQEAEQTLRRAAARLRNRVAQAQTLEFLGEALLEQGRHDEAVRAYNAAIHAVPGFRRPYRGLAESVLRRGQDPARALEYIEKIAGRPGAPRRTFGINGRTDDDYWALKAWALAELGQVAESEAAAKEAIRVTDQRSRPDVATTNRRLTFAKAALRRAGRQAIRAEI